MSVISNSTVFTILAANTETLSTEVFILPTPIGGIMQKGSLTHPTFGTLSYPSAPDEWDNIDTDVVVPPSWGYQKTLGGAANTLHPSSIRDVICRERWISEVSIPMTFLRSLLNYWMNPPDPSEGYVIWSPGYTSIYSYRVIIDSVHVAGEEVTLDYVSRQGMVVGEVEMSYRIAGRVA